MCISLGVFYQMIEFFFLLWMVMIYGVTDKNSNESVSLSAITHCQVSSQVLCFIRRIFMSIMKQLVVSLVTSEPMRRSSMSLSVEM